MLYKAKLFLNYLWKFTKAYGIIELRKLRGRYIVKQDGFIARPRTPLLTAVLEGKEGTL